VPGDLRAGETFRYHFFMPSMDNPQNAGERFMSMFAKQGPNNVVTGIDVLGFVQRLLPFDHCIIASVWLKDVQRLLKMVDPEAFCELLDSGALSFYVDSATTAEIGQTRHNLNLTGRTTRLEDNEFQFVTIRGSDNSERVNTSLHELSRADGFSQSIGRRVAERVEASLLEQKGLTLITEANKDFYRELRSQETPGTRPPPPHGRHKNGSPQKPLSAPAWSRGRWTHRTWSASPRYA
jgi:hypothetical protein